MARYRDRADAGRRLAEELAGFGAADLVVLGLPRGGVSVAVPVADVLRAALDVLVVRKVGAPNQPELAMGAVGEEGTRVVNERVLEASGLDATSLERAFHDEQVEVELRVAALRSGRPATPVAGRPVLVVDDGIATAATARAACLVARARGATRVTVAVPVAPRHARDELGASIDELVCPWMPVRFRSVGAAYDDFTAVSDAEVAAALARHHEHGAPPL